MPCTRMRWPPSCCTPRCDLTDLDLPDHFRRGLDWLFGDNELGESLVDVESDVIWRAIRARTASPTVNMASPRIH